jgi:hypothetical protein
MAATRRTVVKEYGERAAGGIDLGAFEVPEGMVVSSVTLSPAMTREVEEEEPADEGEVEEARRGARYPYGR